MEKTEKFQGSIWDSRRVCDALPMILIILFFSGILIESSLEIVIS
jgi:hypothetical protein